MLGKGLPLTRPEVHPLSGMLRRLLLACLCLAPWGLTARATGDADLRRYDLVAIAPTSTSIYVGRVSMILTPFVRKGGVYHSHYIAKVFPYFFWGEQGWIAIDMSDDNLRQLAKGEVIQFKGHGMNEDGEERHIEGRAVPADANSGKIKVRVFVSKRIQLIFNTTYRIAPSPKHCKPARGLFLQEVTEGSSARSPDLSVKARPVKSDPEIASLPRPVKRHRLVDSRVETLVHGTIARGGFQQLGGFRRLGDGQPELRRNPDDAAWSVGGHLLGDLELEPAQLDALLTSEERHGRRDAGGEGRRGQIGGRKRLAAALVVLRRIGVQLAARGFVEGDAMQLALVFAGDFDHGASVGFLVRLAMPPCRR